MRRFPATLACSECDETYPIDQLRNLCPACSSPLLVHYALEKASELRGEIRSGPPNMWRYAPVLPVAEGDEIVTLGEGLTTTVHAWRIGEQLGVPRLWIKNEATNPTRSFKARGMSAAVTMAKKLGATSLAAPTAGNAGAALAAYGARAGLPIFIAMPDDTPTSIADECRSYGAEVETVPGLITDAAARVQARIRDQGGFDLSTLKEPYRVEGKKTMGYELLEDLGGLPDVIIYPTGGGTGLIGMWKAFDEMERLGWIDDRRPRMISVQAAGCAPIVRAFNSGDERARPWEGGTTSAWGLRVPRAVGDRLILRALRDSGGLAVSVDESLIEPAAQRLRRLEGIDAGPETGAAVAALEILFREQKIEPGETVVVFNTGGDKYV